MAPLPVLLPWARDAIASLGPRTSTTLSSLTKHTLHLLRRQSSDPIIPTTYGSINSGPPPGTVVGIVLGSVGGFLLILYLIYTCMNFGTASSASTDYSESVVVRERRKSRRGSTSTRRETVEVRRERSPIRIVREERREPERVERIVVEESRETRRERPRSVSRGSDEVVVIEEHSPPRRKKSTRVSAEAERRESGYRTVDPLAYGGAVGGRKSSGRR